MMPMPGIDVETEWRVPGVGDFNGDGRDDVLWRNSFGTLTDWLSTAAGGFIINDANAFANVPMNWQVAGIGDFNGDNRDDILWRNDTGQLSNWLGLATGGFVINDQNAFASVGTEWRIAGVGDFNGDNRDDILWVCGAQISNWLGLATGGFTPNDGNALTTVASGLVQAGVGDFNGDGRDDILWRDSSDNLVSWLANSSGGFSPGNTALGLSAPNWGIAGVGDFNGDDRDDILWRSHDGALTYWLANNSGGFVSSQSFLGGGTPQPPPADLANTWELSTGPAWDEVMANLATFFSEMEQNFTEVTQGNDQDSHYRDPYNDAGTPGSRHDAFMALIDSYSVHPYYYEGVDPEFEAAVFSHYYSPSQSSGGAISVTPLAPGIALFTNQNVLMRGTWHPSDTPPPPPPPPTGDGSDNSAIVYGDRGYWTFESIGYVSSLATQSVPYFGSFSGSSADSEANADVLDGNNVDTSELFLFGADFETLLTLAKLDQIIATVTLMLSRLPPDGKLVLDGHEITVRHLQELWARADFRVDPAGTADLDNPIFSGLGSYGNAGVGMAIRDNGNPLFVIDFAHLGTYMNGSFDRALHYVLHELIHVTVAGNQVVINGGMFGTTANPVESWTSRMAQALATAGGLPYAATFSPPGYPRGQWGPSGPAIYVPPPEDPGG